MRKAYFIKKYKETQWTALIFEAQECSEFIIDLQLKDYFILFPKET